MPVQLHLDSAEPPVDSARPARARAAWCKLAACCCAIGATWLFVLPWLSGRPRVREHLDWLDARQIDASAMYYTELEAMRPILQRLEGRQPSDEPR